MGDVLVFVHFTFFLLIMIWTIGSEALVAKLVLSGCRSAEWEVTRHEGVSL
jgi:hypothetical protein